MKKLFLIIVLLSAIKCFAQEKIKGIGKFKINESTRTQVDSILAGDLGQQFPDTFDKNENNFLSIHESKWAILTPDSTPDYAHPYYNYEKVNLLPLHCSMATVYFIKSYSIANIQFESVYLTFRKDTLVGFVSDYSEEITDAMKLKYGNIQPTMKTTLINCQNKIGNKFTKDETEIIYSWKNGSIEAKSYFKQYGCNGSFLTYFSVKDNAKLSTLQKCSNDAYLKIKGKLDTQKKKSLKDF